MEDEKFEQLSLAYIKKKFLEAEMKNDGDVLSVQTAMFGHAGRDTVSGKKPVIDISKIRCYTFRKKISLLLLRTVNEICISSILSENENEDFV